MKASVAIPEARSEQENRRRSRQLFVTGLVLLGAALAWSAYTAQVADPLHLFGGLAIFTLAALPGLLWAKRGARQLPVFEVQMITGVNAFALPLLNSAEKLRDYDNEVIGTAARVVLLFQLAAIGVHALVRGRVGRTAFYTEEVIPPRLQQSMSTGLALATAYTFVNVYFTGLISYELNSILRAAFFGIGLVCTFVKMRQWGQGSLKRGEAGMIVLLLSAQVVMLVSTLFLVGGISILVLSLIGYVSGSRRLPFIPILAGVALVGVLHNGKAAMREIYWDADGNRTQVKVTDLPAFYADWINHGLAFAPAEGEVGSAGRLVDRTSLLHILCLIVHDTPRLLPFLEGRTYAQIPGQFVPRFFWPAKPLGHISNNTLAKYYQLQDDDAALKTTIGFGFVAEAFANYGFLGVTVIGCLLGFCYKKVQVAAAECAQLSYAGLLLVVLMAWSFQTEYTMSIWLSSFYQACVAVLGIPFLIRRILG